MSTRFFTSDLHLGHDFVARTRGFDSADEHDAAILDAWASTVGARDQVWVLGDLTMSDHRRAIEQIAKLPGTKHLIAGNHDACHPMHRRAHTRQREYFAAFESVQTMATMKIADQKVLLSHFPYTGDHAGTNDRYPHVRLRDEGYPLLCGHVHDEWAIQEAQFNVGVDVAEAFAPFAEPAIAAWLKERT
ncbi:metallophosphoesterase family protein [Brevibacterium luteolum]|uniref:metallophosphoesterase family protein n=1 Tax=Brevibacterium luteolum TaxID=199591 RepID=UPI001C2382D7|nr:metallophosphoesterase family protein [Brevibacterium luteolum]MBU8579551.1 metallophosphoesterase family protein [Brevibacterium luteolum]